MNRQAMGWEKILAKYMFVKRFASEIHVINNNTNSPILKNGQMIWTDPLQRKTNR